MRRKRLIAIIAILGFAFIFKIGILDNINFLCHVAEGFDDPSPAFYFTLGRIYRVAEKRDIGKYLIENIDTGKNQNLHYRYIRVLGVIGENDAITCLAKTYVDHQNQDTSESRSKKYIVIRSLGFIGDEEVVPFLEKILNRQSDKSLNFVIAQALYLLTGKKYDFVTWQGENQELFVSEELMQARQVILNTRGKKRKLEDMIILDSLLRPPGR